MLVFWSVVDLLDNSLGPKNDRLQYNVTFTVGIFTKSHEVLKEIPSNLKDVIAGGSGTPLKYAYYLAF